MTNPFLKNSRIAILATLALLFIYCGQSQAASASPAFVLPNAIDGTMVNSNSFKGKVILVNFFTTL